MYNTSLPKVTRPPTVEGVDPSGCVLASLHPSEAEGWEEMRRGHAATGRTCFGSVCASVLGVHVAMLDLTSVYGIILGIRIIWYVCSKFKAI